MHKTAKKQKNTNTPYFVGSRSFKSLALTSLKSSSLGPTNASYDKQHVCAYLQLFSR